VVVHGDDALHSEDILDLFLQKFSGQSGTGLHLVVGPAGMGKSVLFEDLFSRLYAGFQESRKRLRSSPRPLPLVPEYLQGAMAPTLRGLVHAFLRTEFAASIEMETFQWMMVNGFGIWLIDGLDELVESDTDFFNELLEILTKPGSIAPTIMLLLRDSLLTTNQNFREFLDEYRGNVTIYELSRWDNSSKWAFARIELKAQQVEPFMKMLQTHEELNSLSSIPFYCRLLMEEYKGNRLRESYSEQELLSSAMSGIMEREYGKGLLDKKLLPLERLLELLQDLASDNAAVNFQGLTQESIKVYTQILLPKGLDQETVNRLTTHMVQLAVFRQGAAPGSVRFAQEILEHFLFGECLYRDFCTDEVRFLHELSRQFIPVDWVTLKIVASKARDEGKIDRLLYLLKRGGLSDIAFRNVLQICAYVVKDPVRLKSVPFEGRKIPGIKFSELDFRGVSFRECDLTDVEFGKCLLQDATFEDAIISRTVFFLNDAGDLKGALFGKMGRLYSIRTQPRGSEIEDKRAREWLQRHTGMVEPLVNPCDAALQLRYLFSKFICPDGTTKRAILGRPAALGGKEYFDRGKTLEVAIRHGYLISEVRYRDRIGKCEGDKSKEMVNYVMDLTLSPGLRTLLDDICRVRNCQHIPATSNT